MRRYALSLFAALAAVSCGSSTVASASWAGKYRLVSINGAPAPWSDVVDGGATSACMSAFQVASAELTLGQNGPNLRYQENGETLSGSPIPCPPTATIVELSTYTTSGDQITIASAGTRFDHGSRTGSRLTLLTGVFSTGNVYVFERE